MGLFSKPGYEQYWAKIDNYVFAQYLRPKVQTSLRLELSDEAWQLICRGFRQYLKAWVKGEYRAVAMVSQSVDALWHEMILNTREYKNFCDTCLGKFLHHTSRDAEDKGRLDNTIEIWQTWQMCAQEMKMDEMDFYTLENLGPLFDSDKIIFGKMLDKARGAIREIELSMEIAIDNNKKPGFFWFSTDKQLDRYTQNLSPNDSIDNYHTGNMQEVFNYLSELNHFNEKRRPQKRLTI